MLKQSRRPIKTSLGFLVGRDAISLNWVQPNVNEGSLRLDMQTSGGMNSPRVPYDYLLIVTFFGVLAYQVIELDSADHLSDLTDEIEDDSSGSSFDEVLNSYWITALGGKVTKDHKHYQVSTYDDVFDVVCERYEMLLYQRV